MSSFNSTLYAFWAFYVLLILSVFSRFPTLCDGLQLSFDRVEHIEQPHESLQDVVVHTDTFLSIPMDLEDGEMIFTPQETTKMQMPSAGLFGYAILGFHGEIVDANNESAPLSRIYDHHWIAVQKDHNNPLCDNSPNYVFGIGAESRNTNTQLPVGHGYHVEPSKNEWGANIHLLHTEGLSGDPLQAAKECNECYYAPNKGPNCTPEQNGTFQCCGDYCADHTCFCPTIQPHHNKDTQRFYLRYSVNYTYDIKNIQPVEIGIITAPNCHLFYDVLENDEHPENLTSSSYTVPQDAEVVFAVGHQHVGAINISLFKNDEFVCASFPTYGKTPDKPGDERGFVVQMSNCIDKDTTGSVKLHKGDSIRVDSWYWTGRTDERIYPQGQSFSSGTHLNVMAYMYLAFAA
jgi:hypothetical protein